MEKTGDFNLVKLLNMPENSNLKSELVKQPNKFRLRFIIKGVTDQILPIANALIAKQNNRVAANPRPNKIKKNQKELPTVDPESAILPLLRRNTIGPRIN